MIKARLLAVALAAAALAHLAHPGAARAATHHPRPHAHHEAPSFPMTAAEYRLLMDKRIEGVRGVIDRKLERRGVSGDRRKSIHKIFDEASKELRAEIDHATADGTVTQAEANKVKPLVIGLRSKVRERLRAERDPVAKEKLAHEDAEHQEKAARKAAAAKAEAKAAKAEAAKAAAEAATPAKTAHAAPAGDKADKGDKAKDGGKAKGAKAAKSAKATKSAKAAKKTGGHGGDAGGGPTKQAKDAPAKKKAPEAPADGEANL